MARMIQIICKTDGVPFLIAPRKGRYPSHCDAHRSATVPTARWVPTFVDASGVKQQLLKCKTCQNVWYRKSVKGKTPAECYNCTAVTLAAQAEVKKNIKAERAKKTADALNSVSADGRFVIENGVKYQILHCESGDHMWKRKSARGKAPRNCDVSHDGSLKAAARSPQALAQINEQMAVLTDTVKSFTTITAETRLANIAARRAAYMAEHSKSTMYTPISATMPVEAPKKRARKPRTTKSKAA